MSMNERVTAFDAYKIKAITFEEGAPTEYAGQTRWIAAKTTATGRASTWCRHYHDTELQARTCGDQLSDTA